MPGNVVRCGIEFDALGRRVAYHLYRSHPEDGRLVPMSGQGGLETVRVDAREVIHLYRVLRPGQIRGEPWLSRALVKLNELDQYDDAELVRKKTAAMFAGFVTRQSPEDNLMGEGGPDGDGIALAGLEPGTLQLLEPGEDIKFSEPADVGGSYSEFLRTQFRAVAAALGITYEQLTGDLTGVNYSSIRAGLLEFRRRCEMVQHGVLVHQLCRPVWSAWMKQAVLAGALEAPGFARGGAARGAGRGAAPVRRTAAQGLAAGLRRVPHGGVRGRAGRAAECAGAGAVAGGLGRPCVSGRASGRQGQAARSTKYSCLWPRSV